MPYENEPSDLKSSGSNVENIISGSLFNSIAYKDNIKINIIKGLQHLESKKLIQYSKCDKNNRY